MRWWFIRLLMRLLGEHGPKKYDGIDEQAKDDWLVSLFGQRGFQSYFTYRDLQLLKSIALGVDRETYCRLIGQRTELLYLVGESKRLFDKLQKEKKDLNS